MSSLNERKAAHEAMALALKEQASHAISVKHRGVRVARQYGLNGVDRIYIKLYNLDTESAGKGVQETPSTNP
jgi:hypothetical protein